MLSGLTRGTSRAHISRAALEGIALEVTDLLEAMAKDLGAPLSELRVDGGASANDFLMQVQADLLGLRLARPKMRESTALGATFLAGLGVGIWKDKKDLRAAWVKDRDFEPAGDQEALASLRAAWQRSVAAC